MPGTGDHILLTVELANLDSVQTASFSQDHGLDRVHASGGEMDRHAEARALQDEAQASLDEARFLAFTEVVVVPELESGFMSVAQAHGIGGVDSNMVAFGWPGREPSLIASMLARVRHLTALDKSVMWMRPAAEPGWARGEGGPRQAGKEQNGDMMLCSLICSRPMMTWRARSRW